MAEEKRKVYEDPILKRLIEHHGEDYIFDHHKLAFYNGVKRVPNYWNIEQFGHVYEILVKNRIIITDNQVPTIEQVHKEYCKFVNKETELCRIHTGQSQNGYPVVSSSLPGLSSPKIPLHQVLDYKITGKYVTKGYVASHLCHNKMCISCPRRERKETNISRDHCQKFVLVNGHLENSCFHYPRCRDISLSAYNYYK